LLEKGADVDKKDFRSKTALDHSKCTPRYETPGK
jgi:hypothetical protein